MGPLCRKKRVQNSICKQTLPLPNSNFSSTDRKSGSSKRGQQTSTQRGSGEDRTGRSRLLFSYFPGSQEEWEITTYNRSVQTEYFSGYSVVQNGDSQQGQTDDSTQRLGVLTRSDRCLSTCSYSPAVSEVSPFLSQGSGLAIQGSSIRPCDKSLCFHPFDGCHSNISTEKGNCSVSIFGRLVGQKSGSSRNSERPTVYNRTDYVPRTDNQRRKVRFGSVSELCVHRNGIPNTQEHSSSAIRQSTGHSGSVTVVQETETGLSKSLSVSSGKTKCCSSICSIGQATLQMALFAQWKPHVLPLGYPILLNAPIRKHLEWWDNKGRFISGVTLKPSLPTHSLFTDASLSGWGAHLDPEGLLFHGVWTPD